MKYHSRPVQRRVNGNRGRVLVINPAGLTHRSQYFPAVSHHMPNCIHAPSSALAAVRASLSRKRLANSKRRFFELRKACRVSPAKRGPPQRLAAIRADRNRNAPIAANAPSVTKVECEMPIQRINGTR